MLFLYLCNQSLAHGQDVVQDVYSVISLVTLPYIIFRVSGTFLEHGLKTSIPKGGKRA